MSKELVAIQSIYWLEKGAELGGVKEILRVAREYQSGEFIPVSVETAVMWYKKAAQSSSKQAARKLKYIGEV